MKLKSLLPALAFGFLALTGCAAMNELAGLPVNKGNGYNIKHERQIYGGGVYIEYKDRSLMEQELREEMSARLKPEEETQAAVQRLPDGGQIGIHFEALTIEGANTKWLEYIVFQDGKEIFRRRGRDSIANVPQGSSAIRFWWNTDVVFLRGIDPAKPFEFVVVNLINNKRDRFTISAKS